jgi:hypothetical protein
MTPIFEICCYHYSATVVSRSEGESPQVSTMGSSLAAVLVQSPGLTMAKIATGTTVVFVSVAVAYGRRSVYHWSKLCMCQKKTNIYTFMYT